MTQNLFVRILISRLTTVEAFFYFIFFVYWYCHFSYRGNWELVKLVVSAKFRKGYVCLHSQAGNNKPITGSMTASG